MNAERSGPASCNVSNIGEGKDEMTKASIDLQDLRRRIYVKAKAEPSWRFWGLYVHVCKMETLRAAYEMAKKNEGGGPGKQRRHLRGHRGARRGTSAGAVTGRTDRAYLPATSRAEAGDTEGRGQSPCPLDSGDPRQSGARRAQAHTRACLRGGTSNRDRLDIVPSGQHMVRS